MDNRLFEEKDWNYYTTVIPIMLFVIIFLLWAAFTKIDETIKGTGKVVPSGQTKVIQNLGLLIHFFKAKLMCMWVKPKIGKGFHQLINFASEKKNKLLFSQRRVFTRKGRIKWCEVGRSGVQSQIYLTG